MGSKPKQLPTIIIVIPSFTAGGSERQALYYAKAIQSQGRFQPVMIGLGRDGELSPQIDQAGISKFLFPAVLFWNGTLFQKFKTLFSFWLFISKLKPRYILALTYWPTILCGLVYRFTSANKFYWNQGSVDTFLPFTKWERAVARFCKPTYLANGASPAAFISERHSIPRSKVSIIYNALEIPETIAQPSSETLNVVMLANFFPEKDHETVLRAFALIITDIPNARLHFIGGAPGQSPRLIAAKALAFDLGLSRNVQFHGVLAEPQLILRQADIGILSTLSEGFSNALMEYMAYGLPVVATDIPPNREALGEANLPWLFPVGDVPALGQRLITLLTNADLRRKLGQANREQAQQRFNLERFNSNVNNLFAC
jgi:glycosyltransferase involved in cell wall biosynthesis